MKILKTAAVTIWRIWFYILMIVPILIMLPFLILFTSSEKFYPQFFVCARIWAKFILFGMGLYPITKAESVPKKGESYMLVANHTSMVDIMLMLSVIKQPFIFVGKKELARIPVFGFFYHRTCILVDRNCHKSRRGVVDEAQRRLKQGNSICIFPEGGVPDDLDMILDTFKDGAFRLAIDHQIPIVPLTFHDTKKRFSYDFFSGSPGVLRVKIHDFISTKGKQQTDRRALKQRTREVILEELRNPDFN
ncbi:lysophospholipid acyltransferase family protein [Salegentibacter chungangensis]|uniref:Lysophospholipid acyltransferase family protein n=1 Tax=Salegentibacter chungangensis TaxID=1335724 RepID=A0ABW3NMY7_9FLAO